jgi:hypothetical protein
MPTDEQTRPPAERAGPVTITLSGRNPICPTIEIAIDNAGRRIGGSRAQWWRLDNLQGLAAASMLIT